VIYEALQNETHTRPGRKVTIINLGLEPDEAIRMGLQIEPVEKKEKRLGVGAYVSPKWAEWLQTHRSELNAMPSETFLTWLDRKMEEHGQKKLMPPIPVIGAQLRTDTEKAIRDYLTDIILDDVNLDEQVNRILETVELEPDTAHAITYFRLRDNSAQSWRAPIEKYARQLGESKADPWNWRAFDLQHN
jgi:hypothetical protein